MCAIRLQVRRSWCAKRLVVLTSSRTNKRLKKEENKASKQLMAKIAKICPGCKRPIEKSYGCDHMTCKSILSSVSSLIDNSLSGTKCRHEFCWRCLAPYKKKRDYQAVTHYRGCLYFHDNADNRPRQAVWEYEEGPPYEQ